MVLVEVDGYAGRASVTIRGRYFISIVPRTQQWDRSGSTCSRTQIPLTLAFAITVHKSQGLTLDQAVLNLDVKRIDTPVFYVGLSRVRNITSLGLEACAPLNRFKNEVTLSIKMRLNDAARRQDLTLPYLDLRPRLDSIDDPVDNALGPNPKGAAMENAMDHLTAMLLGEVEEAE